MRFERHECHVIHHHGIFKPLRVSDPKIMFTSKSHHRVNTYYPSFDKVLSELELRFSGNDQDIIHALGDVCQNKALKVEIFATVAQFYGIDQEILQVEQEMFTSLRQEHGFPEGKKVAEVLQLMRENDLFDMLPEFAKVMEILAVILATSCFAERSFSALRRPENIPPKHHGSRTY